MTIDETTRRMIYHAAVVIWLGLLAGFPFGLVIMERIPGEARAWHMAHMEGILNGLLILGAAFALPYLTLPGKRVGLYAWAFILTGYANVVASVLGAIVGERGLEIAPPFSNLVVFSIFVVGVLAVLVGLYLMLRGAAEGGVKT